MRYSDKPYTRLIHVVGTIHERLTRYKHLEFTDSEKVNIADALVSNMSPYEIMEELYPNNNVYDNIWIDYSDREEIDIVLEYISLYGHDTIEEYIETEGLPIPDIDDMTQYIIESIDIEDYINDTMDDMREVAHSEILYNIETDHIIELFGKYINDAIYAPDEEPETYINDNGVIVVIR